ANYISPLSRRGRTLAKRRDDLRGCLWPDVGAEPCHVRQSPCPHGRHERSREGHRSEHLTQRGMVTGFSHSAPPRRGHSRLLRADLGGSAPSLCSWPNYISPPSRGGRTLFKRPHDLPGGPWADLGA